MVSLTKGVFIVLQVRIIRLQEEDSKEEPLVNIKVVMNIPRLSASPNIGLSFDTAPPVVIAEDMISFSEMKEIMDIYGFRNWRQVKKHLEDKYLTYFRDALKKTF